MTKKILHIILLVLCFTWPDMYSQVPSYYLKHTDYEYAANPAITGRDYYPVVMFSHQKYLSGISGSPNAINLGATMRMGTYNFYTPKMMLNKSRLVSMSRMGLGGFVLHEKDGPLKYTHASFSYAYFIPVNDASYQLSFGLSYQFFNYSINKSELVALDGLENDPKLQNLDNQPFISEAGFGIYLHSDQYFLGISANDLLQSDISLTSVPGEKNMYDLFFNTGFKFFLNYFELEPSVWLASINNNVLYYNLATKLYFMQYNWFSVSYRSIHTLRYGLGIKLNRYHIAYFYEHNVGPVIKYNNGTNEIMLGLNIGLYEKQGIRKTN